MKKNAFPLRIDTELTEKIRYIANINSRSINKEIEFLIKKHIEKYENNHGKIIQTKENSLSKN